MKSECDIDECLRLIKESKDVLKIQDILSDFSEFSRIKHFREPLRAALKEDTIVIQVALSNVSKGRCLRDFSARDYPAPSFPRGDFSAQEKLRSDYRVSIGSLTQ